METLTSVCVFVLWLGSLVVRASDLRLSGREFDPRPPHYRLVGTGMGNSLRAGIPSRNVTSHPGQLSLLLSGTGNEYRPKCGDSLQLGVKVRWLILFVDKRVGGRYSCITLGSLNSVPASAGGGG